MDDLNRSRIRQTQQQAKQPTQPLVYRIGDRDPATGKYEMIYPDGSKATGAEKLYSAESKPGDRVLAQQRTDGTWLLSEAGASRRRKVATVSAMPARGRKRSQVWVLYEFEGGLWVGGHQAVPVRISDRPAGLGSAYVWGDHQTWEVALARNNGDIIAVSSRGGITTLTAPIGRFVPIGAGFWEVTGINESYSPPNNGISLWTNFSYTYTAEAGYWSAAEGYKLGRYNISFTSGPLGDNGPISSSSSGSSPSALEAPNVSTTASTANFVGPRDMSSVWLRDRYSAIVSQYIGEYRFAVGSSYKGDHSALRFDSTGETLLLERSNANVITTGHVTFFGENISNIFDRNAPTLIREFWNFAPGLASTRTLRALSAQSRELWYTNGKMVAVTTSEIEKLKVTTQNINIAEVAVDGSETIAPVLGFAIPSAATIYAYCGSLI